MFKRLAVYYKEMFPLLPRFFVAAIMFFEIYFVLLLNDGVTTFHFDHQELIGIFTIFVFLMILRIADDFKDYETDRRLFPHRALPSGRVKKKDFFPYLRYQIVTCPDLTDFYQVNQELAVRIRVALKSSETIEDLVEQVATKRYTKARVRRLLTYILVGARQEELPSGIHILGFSEQGRQHLSKLKGKVELVSRIGKEPWDSLTQKADKVYQLGNPALTEQNFGRVPIMKDK